MIVRSVDARARLAEPGSELDAARRRAAAGDGDWQLWVEEYDSGQATLIDMTVSITVELSDGVVEAVQSENHQLWMHLAQHPPLVAALIAELAGKDFEELATRLQGLRETVTVSDLENMYVRVELADDLIRALRPVSSPRAPRSLDARPGLETEHG